MVCQYGAWKWPSVTHWILKIRCHSLNEYCFVFKPITKLTCPTAHRQLSLSYPSLFCPSHDAFWLEQQEWLFLFLNTSHASWGSSFLPGIHLTCAKMVFSGYLSSLVLKYSSPHPPTPFPHVFLVTACASPTLSCIMLLQLQGWHDVMWWNALTESDPGEITHDYSIIRKHF